MLPKLGPLWQARCGTVSRPCHATPLTPLRPQVSSPSPQTNLPHTIRCMERYRLHAEAAVYYLTYAIVEWLPVFVAEASCKLVTDSLTFCHRQKHLRINAYVVMGNPS